MMMLVRAWNWDLGETDWKYVLDHYKGEGEGSDWAELMGSEIVPNSGYYLWEEEGVLGGTK